jgi:hypothetical protein
MPIFTIVFLLSLCPLVLVKLFKIGRKYMVSGTNSGNKFLYGYLDTKIKFAFRGKKKR